MMKHGYGVNSGKNPTYRSWESMKYRCDNPGYSLWSDYGGRGITYCDRLADFRNFLSDMGPRPEGKTLDRINSNGNYEPENCRWADAVTQRHNRRDVRLYEYRGDLYMLERLARDNGLSIHFLYQRIHRDGMTVEDAVNKPSRIKNPKSANNRAQDKAMQ
jgi:hypothetical protein